MKKRFIWILAAFLILQFTACAPSVASQVEEQLKLGEKYLTEENYEEAIVAFSKVIELDPKAGRAYIGMADAYERSGEAQKAVDILEEGYAQVPGEEIKTELLGIYEDRALESWNNQQYGEAEAVYLRVIELEPGSLRAYLNLYYLYTEIGDGEKRQDILQKGLEAYENLAEEERTEEIEAEYRELLEAMEVIKLQETVSANMNQLQISFTVDSIELGASGIGEAKAVYEGRPYANSNLMNDDTDDTVYTCYGMDMPIPEGYEEGEFGFFFVAPASGGPIYNISIADPSFTCLGALHVGDSREDAFALFGIPDTDVTSANLDCRSQDGRTMQVWLGEEGFGVTYTAPEGVIWVDGNENGKIHRISLDARGEYPE